jgi:predicted DCC family thiol-disulfide oxidoreductase YuxK
MLYVIYDDRCGFCMRSLKVCRAFDIGRRLRFHGASDVRRMPGLAEPAKADAVKAGSVRRPPEGRAAFPQLADADFENAMFTVAPDGSVARGFFAFRRVVREVPLMWPLLLLFYFPGSGAIGPRAYAWVARNRGRFGCESEVCDLPEPGRPRL